MVETQLQSAICVVHAFSKNEYEYVRTSRGECRSTQNFFFYSRVTPQVVLLQSSTNSTPTKKYCCVLLYNQQERRQASYGGRARKYVIHTVAVYHTYSGGQNVVSIHSNQVRCNINSTNNLVLLLCITVYNQ